MSSTKSAIMAALVLGIFCARADAVLPPDQNIKYRIREVPTDPQSRVVWDVILRLSAYSSSGNSVKWNVDRAEFIQYDSQGSVIAGWVESSPAPGTPNGLWLVEHVDPEKPLLSEFDSPPLMNGKAVARDANDPDLDYDFEGGPNLGPSSLYSGNVSAITYRFAHEGEAEPEGEGDDEPAEIQPEEEPT